MHTLRMASIRSAVASLTFAASALLTAGTVAAAPGDYCLHADGTVYCGVEENIYGGAELSECIWRWEQAIRNCPPD